MLSITLASVVGALVATAANAAPLADSNTNAPFSVLTIVPLNQSDYSGQVLSLYHVGAAENAVVVTKNHTNEATFQLFNTQVRALPGQAEGNETVYDYLSLIKGRPYRLATDEAGNLTYAAPKGYHLITANQASSGTPGFSIHSTSASGSTNSGGTLAFKAPASGPGTNWAAFAVCHVVGALNSNDGDQFLWRDKNVKADTTGQCYDVSLYTVNPQ